MTDEANDDAVTRIRRTWALAVTDANRTGHVFYSNLFRIDPSTKPLFVGDLTLQAKKLIQTLSFIVDHLEDSDALMPAAIELAKRHVDYNVTADQYHSVGLALIETFKQLLGPAFSSQDEKAWRDTYSDLSAAMIKAAYPA